MITEPTVLILGAGASVDYGFPTGRRLLFEICDGTRFPFGALPETLTETMDFRASDVTQFSRALQYSGAPSVDLFLENRKEFEEIGKLAIAATLIPYEDYDALKPVGEPRWYEKLFWLMAEGGKFEDNLLSVITFNYDRSLEAFFFQALQNLYGLNVTTATSYCGRFKSSIYMGRLVLD